MPDPARLAVSLSGITDLPPGRIASIVTYFERPLTAADAVVASPAGLAFERLTAGELGRYLALYRRLGERWMWFSRLVMPPSAVAAILDDERVEALAVTEGGRDIGLLELDRRPGAEHGCEIVFIGLLDGETGRGRGRALIGEAARRAAQAGDTRLWLHTCTMDDARAPGFYAAMGFRAWKQAVEIDHDPRLTGAMPRSAAPHLPIFDP